MSLLRTCLLLSSLTVGLGACSEAPEDGDCKKLLKHLIQMEVSAGQFSEADKAKQAEELESQLGKEFLARCQSDIKASQVTCSLKAKSKADLEACDG